MYKEEKPVHTVDFLFTMALFCIFAVTAFFILFIGADIYQTTASNLGENSQAVTAMTYISEKVRQQDTSDAVFLSDVDGIPALALSQNIQGTTYVTYIYEYDDSLMELYCRSDMNIAPSGGSVISPVQDFSVEQVSDQLYRITLTDTTAKSHSLLLSTRTQ